MLDVMFEVPSQENVKLVRITKEAVDGTEKPIQKQPRGDYGNQYTMLKSCSVRQTSLTIRRMNCQIALAGRSNVGKSSFINTMLNRKNRLVHQENLGKPSYSTSSTLMTRCVL